MATDTRNLPAFFNVDADFRSWCQGIHAQFVAAGWTQTADTGQINNTTVSKPGGTNTSQGYEIWRNSTSDIYFKIEYGSGAQTAGPGLWITLGTGSNGSGTITASGGSFSRNQLSANFVYAAGQVNPSYCSGDGTYLTFVSNVDTTAPSSTSGAFMFFFIDKIRDASGTPTGEGFALSSSSGNTSQVVVQTMVGTAHVLDQGVNQAGFTGTWWPANSSVGLGGGVRSYGGSEFVAPAMIAVGQLRFLKAVACYNLSDFGSADGITFTVSTFGGSHTYMGHSIIGISNTNRGPNGSDGWAFLWE